MHKKQNNIVEEEGDVLTIDVSTPSYPYACMLVDRHVWERFISNEEHGTCCATRFKKTDKSLYVVYTEGHGRDKRKVKRFHRYVLPEVKCVDHINRNGLDNRVANLRDGGGGVNQLNQGVRVDSRTGYRGVAYRKDTGKYSAAFTVNRKTKYLGCYDTAEEANNVVSEERRRLGGSYE